jgi:outer membrane protein OmpA-like peptidoglycan-associated protein
MYPKVIRKIKKPVLAKISEKFLVSALTLSMFLPADAFANVVGVDTQNFNPTTSGLDFVTVHSSETLQPGVVNFGLFLNHAVNTLPYFDNEDAAGRQSRVRLNDTVTGLDLNMGIGLMRNWDVGLSLPQVISQSVKDKAGSRSQFAETGNTEIRVNSKLRLWGDDSRGIAVVGTMNFNRLRNNAYLGKDPGPSYGAELVGDIMISKVALAANIGYRWRNPGEKLPDFPFEPFGNQMIYSTAASYHVEPIDSKVIFEIFGSRPANEVKFDVNRQQSSAEALLGLKHDVSEQVALHSGFGTELINGVSSPDWRIYAGLNWSVGPVFSRAQHPVKTSTGSNITTLGQDGTDPFAGTPTGMPERVVMHDILFEFDSDTLVRGGSADEIMGRLVNYANQPPKFKRLVIEGHTCSVGSLQYNMDLSRRRALTIKKWLVEKYKLNPATIEAVGVGPQRAIGDNGNYQGRQLNRRVEFKIYRE